MMMMMMMMMMMIIIIIIIVSAHGFLGIRTVSFPGTRWPPVTLGIYHLAVTSFL